MHEKCIEAASRSECVAKCKAQGIAPISVKEGGKVSSASQRRGERKTLSGKLILLAVAVVVGIGVWWVISSCDNSPDTTPERPKAIKPVKAKIKETSPIKAPITNPAPKPPKAEKPEYVKKPGQLQLPDGRMLTFPIPKEGEFRMVHSHGKIYKCDHLGNFEDVTPKPVFDNSFEENLIGMSIDKGSFIPGMLMGLNKDAVLKMLNKPVTINPDDPEDIVAKKQSVVETKKLALKYMEETGGSFDDFVMDMRTLVAEERGIRGQAMREIVGLLREGRLTDAVAYKNQLNSELSKNGISPLKLPARIEEMLETTNSK